jgi:polar amino acid transport system substrate-binding protein
LLLANKKRQINSVKINGFTNKINVLEEIMKKALVLMIIVSLLVTTLVIACKPKAQIIVNELSDLAKAHIDVPRGTIADKLVSEIIPDVTIDVPIRELNDLANAHIAVPRGTVADKIVSAMVTNVTFEYFDDPFEAALAVKMGRIAASAYDEPIIRLIADKNPGLRVLNENFSYDDYCFAVQLGNDRFKMAMDTVIERLKSDGSLLDMKERWFPKAGPQKKMPVFELNNSGGIIRFGTSGKVEPYSFLADDSEKAIGFDIELANLFATELNMGLEIIVRPFGELIPMLERGELDMIGACITWTEERTSKVLFSVPYDTGGIAALVRE